MSVTRNEHFPGMFQTRLYSEIRRKYWKESLQLALYIKLHVIYFRNSSSYIL